jgi:hypothetical protein
LLALTVPVSCSPQIGALGPLADRGFDRGSVQVPPAATGLPVLELLRAFGSWLVVWFAVMGSPGWLMGIGPGVLRGTADTGCVVVLTGVPVVWPLPLV